MTPLTAVATPDPEEQPEVIDIATLKLDFDPTLGEMAAVEKASGVSSADFGTAMGTMAMIWLALRRSGRDVPFSVVSDLPVSALSALTKPAPAPE